MKKLCRSFQIAYMLELVTEDQTEIMRDNEETIFPV